MPDQTESPLVHVEVLDFDKDPVLVEETIDYYCSLKPERHDWSVEKRRRLAIRTECRWGRVPIGDSVYMLSEFGEGPKAPLSNQVASTVKFFAEMKPSAPGAGDGFIEQAPFCAVQFDADSCRKLRARGLVQLEEFIRKTVPEYEKSLQEWAALLLKAQTRYLEFKSAKAAKAPAPQPQPEQDRQNIRV